MPHPRDMGPGEGWLDIFGPGFNWMEIRPVETYAVTQQDATNLPTVIPPDIATAEVCFRLPDGSSVCTVPGIYAQSYRNQGYEEIPSDAPEFIPPPVVESTRYEPPPVVSSGPPEDISEDAGTVAIEWGTIVQTGLDILNQWGGSQSVTSPQYFAGAATPSTVTTPAMTGGACGCNRSPCVCGTINGRPALVDPRTGKRCYRRRRRVMLTEGDFNTLLRIATLPNNANVRTALAKAIGRR